MFGKTIVPRMTSEISPAPLLPASSESLLYYRQVDSVAPKLAVDVLVDGKHGLVLPGYQEIAVGSRYDSRVVSC